MANPSSSPNSASKTVGLDWISQSDILDLLRAGLDGSDFEGLRNQLKDLRNHDTPMLGSERQSQELKLSEGVRRAIGQLFVSVLHQGLVPKSSKSPNYQDETKKTQLKHAESSRNQLSEAFASVIASFVKQLSGSKEGMEGVQGLASILLQPMIAQILEAIEKLKAEQQATRQAVDAESTVVNKFINAPHKILDCLETGPLRDRYENNFPVEKSVIAEYLAAHVFHEKVACFLQASTTIVHLADVLRKSDGLKKDSIVHTNSTAFAYLMLGRNPKFQIYTVCGKEHDALCGGWLFDENDTEATEYFRKLFRREKTPLQLAIVTPQFLTVDGRAWFANPKTSLLVSMVLQEANKIIVTSPAQRIYATEGDLHASRSGDEFIYQPVSLLPSEQDGPVQGANHLELIVAGHLEKLVDGTANLKAMAQSINANCWYADVAPGDWKMIHSRSICSSEDERRTGTS